MTLYPVVLSLHVVTAVLGVGPIAALSIIATSTLAAARDEPAPASAQASLNRLARWSQWSLVVMLLSGALIDYAVGGGLEDTLWFRASFALLLATGFVHSRIGRALRKARESALPAEALRRIARHGWTMCGLIAVIVVLMEVKP